MGLTSSCPCRKRDRSGASRRRYERRAALATDRIAALKAEYLAAGGERSNVRDGYVRRARG